MSRRIVLYVGVGALVLVCVAIAILVNRNGSAQPNPTPTPSPSVTKSDTQQTLLFAVRADSGLIADSVGLGARVQGAALTGSWLSMQPGLAVDVADLGQVTIADRGPASPEDTGLIVGNQLGIDLEDVVILDRLAFAALVDAVNGVQVEVKQPIVVVMPDGKTKVLVRAGRRTLYGPAAADYVVTLLAGETQAERMARFDEVLRQVIVKLPPTGDRTRDILASLGSSSRSSGSLSRTADTLLQMRTAILDEKVKAATVPATREQLGPRTIYTLLPDQMLPIATDLFAPSLLIPGKNGVLPRIRVTSAGVSFPTLVLAQESLLDQELTFVWGGLSESQKESRVYVAAQRQRQLGLTVAAALGLPSTTVVVDRKQTVGVQAAVYLARDTTLFVAETASATPTATVTS